MTGPSTKAGSTATGAAHARLMVPSSPVRSGVSDLLINALFGALNVGLFYWLLWRVDRAGLCPLDEACRIGLTVLFAFGTTHFWQSCAGQIWFAVQIVTVTAVLASLLARCSPLQEGEDIFALLAERRLLRRRRTGAEHRDPYRPVLCGTDLVAQPSDADDAVGRPS